MAEIVSPIGYRVEAHKRPWYRKSVDLGTRRLALARHLSVSESKSVAEEFKTVDRIRQRCSEILLTLAGDEIVAFGELTFQPNQRTARLEYVQVAANLQRQGLFKNILVNCETEARANKARGLTMEVDENAPHRTYLERIGYEQIDRPAINMIRLRKKL